jgi:hypothetical protein
MGLWSVHSIGAVFPRLLIVSGGPDEKVCYRLSRGGAGKGKCGVVASVCFVTPTHGSMRKSQIFAQFPLGTPVTEAIASGVHTMMAIGIDHQDVRDRCRVTIRTGLVTPLG